MKTVKKQPKLLYFSIGLLGLVALSSGFLESCQGRTNDNVVANGDTVEVFPDETETSVSETIDSTKLITTLPDSVAVPE